MLEGLLHHKKEPKEYLCALTIGETSISSALWETGKDGSAQVLAWASADYSEDWEKAIDAADQAISKIEEKLPEGIELQKVVFGLYPEWLAEDHIKETYLKHLKQLTSALSLTPVGFVEMPVAIAHFLSKEEGTQQTVILVGLEKKSVTVSLFKIGKLIGTKTVPRSAQICVDIEKILISFTDVEVLPSRILLYGSKDAETVKAEMLSYPWQKKANFLHFPKIETLPAEYPVKAVAIASASELTGTVESPTEVEVPAATTPVVKDDSAVPKQQDEVAEIAKDLGFVSEKETEVTQDSFTEGTTAEVQMPADVENVEPVNVQMPAVPQKKFTFPKLTFTVKLPKVPKAGYLVGAVVALVLLFLIGSFLLGQTAKASVTILVQPKLFDKLEEITIDTNSSTNPEQRILAGKIEKIEVSGSATVDATGDKVVGERAKGEVTIFNKTLNSKTFKKGTRLSSGKLNFTLDSEINIASASEGVGSLTFGTAKGKITAEAIGTASNLGQNTDFTFDSLPSSSYSSRNEKALEGGTSRDVLVVTREDHKAVREKALVDLEKQATTSLQQKLGVSQKVLDGSLDTEVVKETYSTEIGEEAGQVNVDVALEISAATYSEAEFNDLINKLIETEIASGFESKAENTSITIEDISKKSDTAWVFKPRIRMKLLPKVDTSEFAKKISGKSIDEAAQILRQDNTLIGAEFYITAPFEFLKKKLPKNSGNITFAVSTL